MLELLVPRDDIDNSIYAGSYVESGSIEPGPGRLRADGSLVSKTTFPQLFAKIGHWYTSGSKAGNGSEGDNFRLPNPDNHFLRPTDSQGDIGRKFIDKMIDHNHSISVGEAGVSSNHQILWWPGDSSYGGFRYGHSYDPSTSDRIEMGHETWITYTTQSTGNHSHDYTLGASSGSEVAPQHFLVPTYIVTGEGSSTAVAVIHSENFTNVADYNAYSATTFGITTRMSKENFHTYHLRHPVPTAAIATINTAHLEVYRQLRMLKERYERVFVIGIGAGALIAARALAEPGGRSLVTRFAGVNGMYNPMGTFGGAVTTGLTRYLGGNTTALKQRATPPAPEYSHRLWHGNNNTMIPASQSSNWGSDHQLLPNLPAGGNIVDLGVIESILAFFKST